MYQRFMLMPLNQPFEFFNRNAELSTWADPDFPAYQYADADGDGFADSRWFELAAARDPAEGGGTDPRDDIERRFNAEGARIFAAARVVDLSSMVNVNTAMDQLAAPNPEEKAPLGATPADIDLRRVLTLEDASDQYALRPTIGLSPIDMHLPRGTRHNIQGSNPEEQLDAHYYWYRAQLEPGIEENERVIGPYATTLSVGRYAYDAIKRGMLGETNLDGRYVGWPGQFDNLNTVIDQDMLEFDTTSTPPRSRRSIPMIPATNTDSTSGSRRTPARPSRSPRSGARSTPRGPIRTHRARKRDGRARFALRRGRSRGAPDLPRHQRPRHALAARVRGDGSHAVHVRAQPPRVHAVAVQPHTRAGPRPPRRGRGRRQRFLCSRWR